MDKQGIDTSDIVLELKKVIAAESVEQLLEVAKEQLWSPLHWAAALGSPKLIKDFINNGCHVNAVDSQGNTALHLLATYQSSVAYTATKGNVTQMLKYLMEAGANPSAVNLVEQTATSLAAAFGDQELAAQLARFEFGRYFRANENFATDKLDNSAMSSALPNGGGSLLPAYSNSIVNGIASEYISVQAKRDERAVVAVLDIINKQGRK